MKTRFSLFVVVAAIAFAVATPSAFAQNMTQDSVKVTTTKKKVVAHKKRHVAKRRGPAYPELEPFRSFGFVGEYPGSCAAHRASGTCMIDLGYGRCAPCSMGGDGFR